MENGHAGGREAPPPLRRWLFGNEGEQPEL